MVHQCTRVAWWFGCGCFAVSALASGAEVESPFVPPTTASAAVPTQTDPLAAFQFAGVVRMNGGTTVYLRDGAKGTGRWFCVGIAEDGVCAEHYDAEREAVLVRSASSSRWLHLPRAVVASLPIARLPDGAVDWAHMKLSEKDKETEALHLMQDIMFASMGTRNGTTSASSTNPPPDSGATTSPAR